MEWIEQRDKGKPYFLFLHTKAVHEVPRGKSRSGSPYDKPKRYLEQFLTPEQIKSWKGREKNAGKLHKIEHQIADGVFDPEDLPRETLSELIAFYDAGIRFVDEALGELIEALEGMEDGQKTLLIITADHGEGLLDHNFLFHREVYEELLHVPLIVHDPLLGAGQRVKEPVRLSDVVPTILSWAGIETPPSMTGRKLIPASGGEARGPRDFFGYYRSSDRLDYEGYSLRRGNWKIVLERLAHQDELYPSLFDLDRDPDELQPIEDRPEVIQALKGLVEWYRDKSFGEGEGASIELDDEVRGWLEALGY